MTTPASPASAAVSAPAEAAGPAAPLAPAPPAGAPNAAVVAGPARDAADGAVKVDSFRRIDLSVKDLEITKVLQLLSMQSQRNIIASRNVSGSVSANLYGVDLMQALGAILHTNGLGYVEDGDFVYVYTAQELKTINDSKRATESELVRLNYVSAAEAGKFVAPLLSPAGAITLSAEPEGGFQPTVTDGGANKWAHSDTLVIRDYRDNINAIRKVLSELDVRPRQVMVEVTVLKAKLTENTGWAADIGITTDFGIENFASGPLGTVAELLKGPDTGALNSGQAIQSLTSSSELQKSASFKLGVTSKSVQAFVHALDQVTDTTVLANPKLLVLNRMKADLLVGERLAYLSTTATETASTQTIEYLDTGTQLSLRPFISAERMSDGREEHFIRMELRPSISSGERKTIGSGASSITAPDVTQESLITSIMVRSGQTAVLGGLFTESTTIGRRQVPGLGDLPLVGAALKGVDDSVIRSEVIFLVTPTVIKEESLYAAGDRAKDSAELARIGAREGLLMWSREKQVAGLLRDAMQHQQAGNNDKALYCANMALNLNPSFVEARRLKESITKQRPAWPHRSLLRDAIDQMVDRAAPKAVTDATPSAPTDQAKAVTVSAPPPAAADLPPVPIPVVPEGAQADGDADADVDAPADAEDGMAPDRRSAEVPVPNDDGQAP